MFVFKNLKLTILCLSVIFACPAMTAPIIPATSSNDNQALPLKDVQRFTTAMSLVKRYYVDPISDQALFDNAIAGMLNNLDPHSDYLDPDEFRDLQDITSGQFSGLGIEVTPDNGFIKVISPIDDSPAQKGGIKPGDIIVRINSVFVNTLSLREAVNRMRGLEGTPVNLTIVRKGEKRPFELRLLRSNIQIQSVKGKLLDDHNAYVRISTFQLQTGADLIKTIDQLKQQTHEKLQGIILDLRNNPGGLLDTAVQVSNALLDSDKLGYQHLIVYTKGRLASSQFSARATGHDLLNGIPIVVLINEGSASAAEIVAGALQDYHRAIVIGTRSFGKGSVQTVLPLDSKTGIKITTALYYTPAGRSIQAEGIKPDITVTDVKIPAPNKEDNDALLYLKESDLKGHLTNLQDKNGKGISDDTNNVPKASDDYQLYEAYNILKGISVLSRTPTNATPNLTGHHNPVTGTSY
jgi:carboxyl-terminal processing protease